MSEKSPIRSFTDLEAWQRARELHAAICAACKQESFRREFKLIAQIKDSSCSVMANIAEGYEKGSRAEYHRYLLIAKGSAGETLSHLYSALDDGAINKDQFESLCVLALRVARIIGALRIAIKPPAAKGAGP